MTRTGCCWATGPAGRPGGCRRWPGSASRGRRSKPPARGRGGWLEAAVRREVGEEVGVVIGDVVYRGSQPWPFPASVMLGFRAYAKTTEVSVDGSEVDQALWFTRESMLAAIERGELLMSPSIS